jgi:hypothetical protein
MNVEIRSRTVIADFCTSSGRDCVVTMQTEVGTTVTILMFISALVARYIFTATNCRCARSLEYVDRS